MFSLSINCTETISRVAEHRLLDPGVFGKENYQDGKTRAFQLQLVVMLMDEGVCSTDLQSRPIRLSVTKTGAR